MNLGSVHGFVHGFVYGLVHGMVDYAVFFPSLSTLTWDTFQTLRGTSGFCLNHVLFRSMYSHADLLKVIRWGGRVAHKTFETAQSPFSLSLFGFVSLNLGLILRTGTYILVSDIRN